MLETPLTKSKAQSTIHQPAQTLAEPFVFVPITQGEAAKGRGAAKRIVRAHVTRVQHAKSSNLHGQDLQSWTVKPYIHGDVASVKRKPCASGAQQKRRPNGNFQTDDDSSSRLRERAIVIAPKLPTGGAGEDPFWSYPVEYQPYLSPIFAHCSYILHWVMSRRLTNIF